MSCLIIGSRRFYGQLCWHFEVSNISEERNP